MVSSLQTVDLVFLFLKQLWLGLEVIGHTVTSVTI